MAAHLLLTGGVAVVDAGGGWLVARTGKAVVEELAESQMTGRTVDPVNVLLDAGTEVLDEAYAAARQSSQGGVRNPYGSRGGTPHTSVIEDIKNSISSRGLIPNREHRVDLLGPGTEGKHFRRIDVAALDVNLKPVEFHQVGDMTLSGLPLSRERRAIVDITEFSHYTHVPLLFWPKR